MYYTTTRPLDERTRTKLQILRDAIGETRARLALGISRGVFERALGGLPVREGSAALVEQKLARLERDLEARK